MAARSRYICCNLILSLHYPPRLLAESAALFISVVWLGRYFPSTLLKVFLTTNSLLSVQVTPLPPLPLLPPPPSLAQGSTCWLLRALCREGGGMRGGVGGEGGADRNGQESRSLLQQSGYWNNPVFRALSSLVGFPLGFLFQAWSLASRVLFPWYG